MPQLTRTQLEHLRVDDYIQHLVEENKHTKTDLDGLLYRLYGYACSAHNIPPLSPSIRRAHRAHCAAIQTAEKERKTLNV